MTPLRKIREARGLSQAEVALAVGLSQSAYCKIEQGARAQADNAEKISQFFGGAVNEIHVLYPERFPSFLDGCETKSSPDHARSDIVGIVRSPAK